MRRLSPHTHTAVKITTATARSPAESKFGSSVSAMPNGCRASITARLQRAARVDPWAATEYRAANVAANGPAPGNRCAPCTVSTAPVTTSAATGWARRHTSAAAATSASPTLKALPSR